MFGHIILDNVKLYDQRDTLMLQASRIAAKVDLMPLVEKKIRISGAQLIGAKAKLYKDGDDPFNFQFLMDAFSKKDSTPSSLNLGIKAFVVRRGDVRFDRLDAPLVPGKFDPNHLHLSDLSLTARILVRVPDTLAVDLRKLSFLEENGLHLKHLSFEGKAGKDNLTIQDFRLEMPKTSIGVTTVQANGKEKWSEFDGQCSMVEGSICPHDFASLVPKMANFADVINLSTNVSAQALMVNGKQVFSLQLPNLAVKDNAGNLSLLCSATLTDLCNSPAVHCSIKELSTGASLQQFLTQNLQGQAREVSPILTRLGSTKSAGSLTYKDKDLKADIQVNSQQGNIALEASLLDMKELMADITATDVRLGHLLNLSDRGKSATATVEATVSGTLPSKESKAKLSLSGLANSLTFNGYEHRNIHFSANIDGETIGGELRKEEPNGLVQVEMQTAKQKGKRSLVCQAMLKDFAPYKMNLTKRYEDERFSANINAQFSNLDPDNLQGELRITDLVLASEEEGTVHAGDLTLTSSVSENGQHLLIQSDFLNARADGGINWKTLPASFMSPVRGSLPSLFLSKGGQQRLSDNNFLFHVQMQDTVLAARLLESNLSLPESSTLEGSINDAIGQIALQLHIPRLQVGGQWLQNIVCQASTGTSSMQTSLQCERLIKGKPVELNLDAYATDDKVVSRLHWDNKRDVAYKGDVRVTGNILRDVSGQTVIDARMEDSRLVVGDTLWTIAPALIRYHDKVVDVENLSISQAEKHINIGGRISALASDTLRAELANIDLSYIMDLVNFHKVDFGGGITGNIYATSLMKKPFADADLRIRDFTFNEARLGDMKLDANWGSQERAVLLDADIQGEMPQYRTRVSGSIIPGRGAKDGLDLHIDAGHIDISFLGKYTKGIFRNLQGRATGWAHVFGPFKKVNLEGDMLVNEAKMHVLALGTDYHLENDSVTLRPDNIWLRGIRVYDHLGAPGMDEHTATVDAHLMHNAFKNLRYDVNIKTNNLLSYNFPTQGSMNFYGTVYTDATVHLDGKMGEVNIDVDAVPMPGTVINYNVATTGTVNETEFVTYVNKREESVVKNESNLSETATGSVNPSPSALTSSTPSVSDIHINFTIDANPNAQIRILMDPRSGDNISLFGEGNLRATYYNKGRFRLFGNYRVSDGNYRMSIRDLIRKDFTFEPGGSIVFGGDPMRAALNLKAKHTVPNVSLDDLSSTGLGLSNTRVDCIMNLGGIACEPVVTFDFDIPNASEEEKQMVRSMLSTKEERDMQAIYLLGVGRFYDFGGANALLSKKQNQGGMAMNSVLSSTLSSRFNQIMSQALGGTGWSFGTNLRTGDVGWERLDVEGLISGKMLSGRLLFNGNFGYRENKNRTGKGSFIGDFEIQYRLFHNSPFLLKAYNQANDRYFTQSSLNTQGIGIKFQRDFNRFREIFLRVKKKSKKDKEKPSH